MDFKHSFNCFSNESAKGTLAGTSSEVQSGRFQVYGSFEDNQAFQC